MAAVTSETDGVVLETRDHGESDLIVTLYCPDSGKITAIAKGARKSKRRFVNKLEMFTFLHLQLRRSGNRSLLLLEEAELHAAFLNLRHDVVRYSVASVIRELMLLGTREGETDEQLYKMLLWTLDSLDRRDTPLKPLMFFFLRYLDYIGYRPEVDCCTQCGTSAPSMGQFRFNTFSGGLVCTSCSPAPSSSLIPLSSTTITLLTDAQDAQLKQLSGLQAQTRSIHEGLNILHRYGRHILQREIHSWKMLRQMFANGSNTVREGQ